MAITVSEAPATEESASPETPVSEAPKDFREYAKWRTTGELPEKPEEPPPAAAAGEEPPPAKTEPQSGADDTQHEEDDEEGEGESAGKRRGSSRQRKIDKLTREVEALKQQLAQTGQPKAEPPKPEQPGKPKLEQFDTLEAYQEALTEWHFAEREKKREAEAQEKAAREVAQKLQTEWDSKQQSARKAHQDYDDAIESTAAPDGPGVAAARQAMLEDDAGAEILYHLAKHPDELKRISAMQPIAAVREIGRLSALFTPPAANGKQKLSAAPKPPPPVTRPAKIASDSIFDPAVQSDYRRWAKARNAKG